MGCGQPVENFHVKYLSKYLYRGVYKKYYFDKRFYNFAESKHGKTKYRTLKGEAFNYQLTFCRQGSGEQDYGFFTAMQDADAGSACSSCKNWQILKHLLLLLFKCPKCKALNKYVF
ncbi:MAG: hypothetical protein H6680_00790 [Desulfobacteraceae bacterium]|nr:hypothetical protein [Desulfobacteraceae bacterium]